MDAESVAEDARRAVSDYCSRECKAYCCRKGFLALNADEVDVVTQGRAEELLGDGTLKRAGDRFSLRLSGDCPSLKDFRCMIHEESLRPLACREFPVFVRGDFVRISRRCPAVKDGLLYPFERMFISLGLRIVENVPCSQLEFSDLPEFGDTGKVI